MQPGTASRQVLLSSQMILLFNEEKGATLLLFHEKAFLLLGEEAGANTSFFSNEKDALL